MKMVKGVLMLLAFLLLAGQTVNAQTWEEVTFRTPYNGEKAMKLLVEYAYAEFDMKLVDGYWTTTLELPKGRYNYIYSSDPSKETDWYPYYSLKNRRHPVKYVGYSHMETENFSFYFAGDLPEEYLNAIARVFETTYQGLHELYGIDLKTRYGLGRKLEVRIDVGWIGTPKFAMFGYIWLQYRNSNFLKVKPVSGRLYDIYGIAHEVSHQTLLLGLGEYASKFTEAFADVMASYLISYYIWPKMGPSAGQIRMIIPRKARKAFWRELTRKSTPGILARSLRSFSGRCMWRKALHL